jgi:hypothetical protein
MAFADIQPRPLAMQEGLRSYIVYDRLLDGCSAFPIEDDSCEPHLHEGEWVAVDTEDRDPMTGELFLIRWESSSRRAIMELSLRGGHAGAVWWGHSYRRRRSIKERQAWIRMGRTGGWSDGPYVADGERAACFQCKIIGKVVGIMSVGFRPERG